MNDISKQLSQSNLFAICHDAKRCKRTCANRFLIKVISTKANILCLYSLVEKEPVFYQIDNKGAKP